MRRLLLAASVASLAVIGVAQADTIFTLGTSNDPISGSGPFARLDVHLIDSTHALFTYDRLGTFVFGEMGGNLNAASFSVSPVTFTLAASSSQTPTFTLVTNSNLDGFGNFVIDETSNPNGFSAAITQGVFTVTNLSGTWASAANVLTPDNKGFEAAVHAFTSAGDSFFAADSSHCDDCVINPTGNVPEPATAALLGVGLLGLGFARYMKGSHNA